MISESGMRPVIGRADALSGDDLGKELGLLIREQRRQEASDRERELNIFRSGSAPPSVEGSLTAVGSLLGEESAPGLSDYHGGENGFMSEEELRSDPAYLEYYYSHVNLNPRLPPPVLSKEDWRFAQRFQAGNSAYGGIGDKRKAGRPSQGGIRSHFSEQPVYSLQKESEMEPLGVAGMGEWLDRGGDGLIGLSGPALGSRQKSIADIFQNNLGTAVPLSGNHPSRPTSRNAFNDSFDTLGSSDLRLSHISHDVSADVMRASGNGQTTSSEQPIRPSSSHTFASVLSGSLSRGATPDPQVVARSPSPCLPPVGGRIGAADKKVNKNNDETFSGFASSNTESTEITASFSGLNISRPNMLDENYLSQSKLQKELKDQQNFLFDMQSAQYNHKHQAHMKNAESGVMNFSSPPQSNKYPHTNLENNSSSGLMSGRQVGFQKLISSPASSYSKVPFTSPSNGSPGSSPARYENNDGVNTAFPSYGMGGYPLNPTTLANQIGTGSFPPLFENAAVSMLSPGLESRALGGFGSGPNAAEMQNLNRIAIQAAGTGLQMPVMDPLYLQYLRTAEYAAQVASGINDPSVDQNYAGNTYADLLGFQKAYLGTLLSPQSQFNIPFLGKSGSLNNAYYGSPTYGHSLSYQGQGSPLMSPVRSSGSVGPGSPLRHNERNLRFPSSIRNINGGGLGPWHYGAAGNTDDGFASSLLEEFKCNKAKCFELSEIAGHVVEFSADQYGSRFIQQKLETATNDEKNMVFEEIFPQALSLMTDVFGNYVIQKFFEHGTPAQRRELADQLTGHVLTLSLQMYGCRVIQKAIEVVDLYQQAKMVSELDGHITRCVRDQNGNHVIQKCIECIPQDAIQFIITSFYDQVVTLSTHPYGCRVIQRVLEHCDDPKTQQIVMDEIMQCVCMLAQDQYGNYVIQHVLEHGKPHERSAIIKQLAGQIVQMSQQKFASNVVEKCLIFGGPDERQLLVNEMLGTTDENEPLQAMMKDQFANYVVQKMLETCDDQQRELILSRIKVHLTALKKYTYGKHIVARVEKLVAAGERRIGMQSLHSSQMAA